nr:hypothetical protein [Tanacetum cinerariifolium]
MLPLGYTMAVYLLGVWRPNIMILITLIQKGRRIVYASKLSFTIDLRGLGFKDEDVNGLYYRESTKTLTDG